MFTVGPVNYKISPVSDDWCTKTCCKWAQHIFTIAYACSIMHDNNEDTVDEYSIYK